MGMTIFIFIEFSLFDCRFPCKTFHQKNLPYLSITIQNEKNLRLSLLLLPDKRISLRVAKALFHLIRYTSIVCRRLSFSYRMNSIDMMFDRFDKPAIFINFMTIALFRDFIKGQSAGIGTKERTGNPADKYGVV